MPQKRILSVGGPCEGPYNQDSSISSRVYLLVLEWVTFDPFGGYSSPSIIPIRIGP